MIMVKSQKLLIKDFYSKKHKFKNSGQSVALGLSS